MDEEVSKVISEEDLYKRTGIQKQSYNTIYQLMAVKKNHPEYLEQAEAMLMVPDYLQFKLTGKKAQEYTEATTGQLVSPITRDWDYELIDMLGFPRKIFLPIHKPGSVLGNLRPEIAKEVGFDLEVIMVGSHDTASAVLAVPANDDDFMYISSGTWSLMGVEAREANCSMESRAANLTNEGGYNDSFRFLKNIMGLWMIQSVRHETGDAYSFAQLCEMAEEAKDFPSRVDANDNCFLAPKNMTEEVKDYCRRTGQQVPETIGEIATVIYASLAECYAKTIAEMEAITGRKYGRIHVVGGGANAGYLNELTAKACKRPVYAGPTEATAIGNLTAQMLRAKEFSTVEEARDNIFKSFGVKEYKA
jgi:rhamnulokinase